MPKYSDKERADNAKYQTDIFNNRVKVVLFLLTVGTGALTIYEKCVNIRHTVKTETTKPATDSVGQPGAVHHATTTASLHRRHSKAESKPATADSESAGPEVGRINAAKPPVEKAAPKPPVPLQTAEAEDIEFRLVSAEGSARAQTIRMTLVLTNHAANRFIWSAVESISDADGNEYPLKSFTNGASSYDIHIPLDTEAPRKCTFTFGGVLPSVKMIRMFKFRYRHKSLDDPNAVEFRDLPIHWR